LLRVKAAVDQFLQQRMIERHLLESVVPQPVEPRIAHVRDRYALSWNRQATTVVPMPSH
jgi:hypothetical protein